MMAWFIAVTTWSIRALSLSRTTLLSLELLTRITWYVVIDLQRTTDHIVTAKSESPTKRKLIVKRFHTILSSAATNIARMRNVGTNSTRLRHKPCYVFSPTINRLLVTVIMGMPGARGVVSA